MKGYSDIVMIGLGVTLFVSPAIALKRLKRIENELGKPILESAQDKITHFSADENWGNPDGIFLYGMMPGTTSVTTLMTVSPIE